MNEIKDVEVVYIGFDIGFKVGNKIFLNKNLKKYPILHDAVLNHELEHNDKGILYNLWHDIKCLFSVNPFRIVYFMAMHPLSLCNFLPVTIFNKELYIDYSKTIIYAIMCLIIILSEVIL